MPHIGEFEGIEACVCAYCQLRRGWQGRSRWTAGFWVTLWSPLGQSWYCGMCWSTLWSAGRNPARQSPWFSYGELYYTPLFSCKTASEKVFFLQQSAVSCSLGKGFPKSVMRHPSGTRLFFCPNTTTLIKNKIKLDDELVIQSAVKC
jgi:hypothetical protein